MFPIVMPPADSAAILVGIQGKRCCLLRTSCVGGLDLSRRTRPAEGSAINAYKGIVIMHVLGHRTCRGRGRQLVVYDQGVA